MLFRERSLGRLQRNSGQADQKIRVNYRSFLIFFHLLKRSANYVRRIVERSANYVRRILKRSAQNNWRMCYQTRNQFESFNIVQANKDMFSAPDFGLLVVIANYICYNNRMKRKAGGIIIELLPSVVRDIYSNMRSLAQPELTVFQFRILSRLFVCSRTNNELALWAGINKATMSRALTTLQKQGLIEKKTDKTDRRGKFVSLTTTGKKKYKAIKIVVGNIISEKIEKIDTKKQKQLLKGLEVLKEVFNK